MTTPNMVYAKNHADNPLVLKMVWNCMNVHIWHTVFRVVSGATKRAVRLFPCVVESNNFDLLWTFWTLRTLRRHSLAVHDSYARIKPKTSRALFHTGWSQQPQLHKYTVSTQMQISNHANTELDFFSIKMALLAVLVALFQMTLLLVSMAIYIH